MASYNIALKRLASLFGYTISKASVNQSEPDPLIDNEIGEIFDKIKVYTMTSKERIYALYKAVQYIINSKIPGDFVECGVWHGGSAMMIAYTLLKMGETDRKIYLYDTFKGMPSPSKEDYEISDHNTCTESEWTKRQKENHNEWCFSPLSVVKKNMLSTKYPTDKLIFVEGKVEDTIPKTIPSKIALLRLDTDWYESTKHELIHLFPILAKNGVLIIDDYGHWAGAKRATDEYFLINKIPVLLNRIDYTGRICTKC